MTDNTWYHAALGMGPWRTWLTDHGSLTRRLRNHSPDFNVHRLRQAIGQPGHDEADKVELNRRQPALIR